MKQLFITVLFLVGIVCYAQQPSRFSENDSTETEKVEPSDNVSTSQPSTSSSSKYKTNTSSTTPKKNSKLDRWRFGGMVGASFGAYTYVELSPRAHYLVKDNLGVGGGFSWYYWRDNQTYPPGFNVKTEGSVYGVNMFSWYNPIGSIVLQGEFEPLNFEVFNFETQSYEREWVNGLLLGGGIRQQTGRANIFIVLLYNVMYDQNRTFYGSPWVMRIGAGF